MESHIERAEKLAKRYRRKTRAIKLVDEKTGFEIDTVVLMRAGCGDGEYWYVPGDEQLYFNTALAEFNQCAPEIEANKKTDQMFLKAFGMTEAEVQSKCDELLGRKS